MKLLIATDAWHPQTNGVVTTLEHMLPELETFGLEVVVMHPMLFKTFALPGYREIQCARNPLAMRRFLDALNVDAVHIATEGPIGLTTRRWCLRNSRTFTTSLHTKFPEYLRARIGLPVSVGYRFLRWFHSKSKTTLVTTDTQQRELAARGLKNLNVWGRGVDTKLFSPIPNRRPSQGRPIALNVGRVAIEKNLDAFLRLEIDCEKWVVGDGPHRAELEKRYPNVRWLGYRYGAELAQLYGLADVFVFPSKTDTFGLVMLEALACGTPVAGYPVTGPIDVVQHSRTGALNDDLRLAVEEALKIDRSVCRNYALAQDWASVARRLVAAACPQALEKNDESGLSEDSSPTLADDPLAAADNIELRLVR